MIVLDEIPAPKPAKTTHALNLTGLRPVSAGWQRAAEVAGIVAAGCLIAAGVFPW